MLSKHYDTPLIDHGVSVCMPSMEMRRGWEKNQEQDGIFSFWKQVLQRLHKPDVAWEWIQDGEKQR